jgi:hypothetical protein
MSSVHPDGSLYSQVLIHSASFAEAGREAAKWLDAHEHDIAVVAMTFTLTDNDEQPVYGTIRYTEA